MTKNVLSALGFAALFVLGTSATSYSDSLPGVAAKTTGANANCVLYNVGSGAVTNDCGANIRMWVPMQSRTTGTFRFFATAPVVDQTQCTIRARNFTDGFQFVSGPTNLNGHTQLGNTNIPISFDTTLTFDCLLKGGAGTQGRLQSVDSSQI